jgi:hypothetical protein
MLTPQSAALNARYRQLIDEDTPGYAPAASLADIPDDAPLARFRRTKTSHRGIRTKTSLRTLIAGAVDQSYLEEIAVLGGLERLELEWPTTATDLRPLSALKHLRFLKIDSPRNITDFSPLLALPALEVLFIENAKHLKSLDWLAPLADRLNVLGIEGSMWTTQRIPTLAPLRGFAVEALFLTGTRIADKDLTPLQTMPNLRFLETACNAPREAFRALHKAKPELVCDWFEDKVWEHLEALRSKPV